MHRLASRTERNDILGKLIKERTKGTPNLDDGQVTQLTAETVTLL